MAGIKPAAKLDVKMEMVHKPRRHTQGPMDMNTEKGVMPDMSRRSSNFVYVNSGFVGSTIGVNQVPVQMIHPPNRVIREQYWTCSKWPTSQRLLAIAVGVLLGAVISLAITMALPSDGETLPGIFRHSSPD